MIVDINMKQLQIKVPSNLLLTSQIHVNYSLTVDHSDVVDMHEVPVVYPTQNCRVVFHVPSDQSDSRNRVRKIYVRLTYRRCRC